MNISELQEGSLITISYKAKEGKDHMKEICERQVKAIKILAVCGLLVGISKYNDLDSFDKWCTISELKYDIDRFSKSCSYSELREVSIFK